MGKYIREADNFMKNNKFWKLGFLEMIFINIASLPKDTFIWWTSLVNVRTCRFFKLTSPFRGKSLNN